MKIILFCNKKQCHESFNNFHTFTVLSVLAVSSDFVGPSKKILFIEPETIKTVENHC